MSEFHQYLTYKQKSKNYHFCFIIWQLLCIYQFFLSYFLPRHSISSYNCDTSRTLPMDILYSGARWHFRRNSSSPGHRQNTDGHQNKKQQNPKKNQTLVRVLSPFLIWSFAVAMTLLIHSHKYGIRLFFFSLYFFLSSSSLS